MKDKAVNKHKKAGWTCLCGKTFSSYRDYFRHVTAVNRKMTGGKAGKELK